METKDYLRILREEIHSTVIATVDKDGRPVTRVIDIMLTDENSLYFITAKGKAFYAQLMENPYVAISGMCGGEGTMNKKAVSIRGKAVNIGSARLKEVFQKNPYMAEIYPQEESRTALEVFQVAEGTGEFLERRRQCGGRSWSDETGQREGSGKCNGAAGRIFHYGPVSRMPYLLQQMSPEMYRYVCKTVCHSAGALPALRKLHGGLSIWSGGEKIRKNG